ncbi:MAG TPA: FecR domain-containing protein, partial [Pedobacter sp.]
LVESGEFDTDYLDVMPDIDEEPVTVTHFKTHPIFKLFVRITVAASLLLISGAGYWAYRKAENLKQQSVFTIVRVPVGSLKIITLTDHSVITLTSGAIFKYPAAFAADSRKVFLIRGKGFFEIAKDKTRPFTVYSANLSTTALGTSFTVENYNQYQMEKICLYTGKVEIGSKDKDFSPVRLSPGQQYTQQGNAGGKSRFMNAGEIQPHTEDGTMEFEDTGLSEALIEVASYYNIDLQFSRYDLRNFAISGKFRNEPVEDVLHTLLFTHHLKFKKIPEGYQIMK